MFHGFSDEAATIPLDAIDARNEVNRKRDCDTFGSGHARYDE